MNNKEKEQVREQINDLYSQMMDTFLSAGINPLSADTSAKLLAILYVYGGGNESFVLSKKFCKDADLACKRLNIEGGETPTEEGRQLIQKYVKELEDDINRKDRTEEEKTFAGVKCTVEWANKLMQERYSIKNLFV